MGGGGGGAAAAGAGAGGWRRLRARAPGRGRAPEADGQRRREQREREPPQGRGGHRALRGRSLLRPPVGARERPTTRPSPAAWLTALDASLPLSPCPPAPRAAALAAKRTRVLWRTRTLGLLPRLEPLSCLRGLRPWESHSVAPWVRQGAGALSPDPLPLILPVPGGDVLFQKCPGRVST